MKTLEITEHEATVILKFFEACKGFIDDCSPKQDNILAVESKDKSIQVPIISSYLIRKKLQDFVGQTEI